MNKMKYIKMFSEMVNTSIVDTIYDPEWENELSEYLIINYHGKLYKFKKDNIMMHADMMQITFSSVPGDVKKSTEEGEIWGAPDTLEIDMYFAKNIPNDKIRMNIDITYGDFMACEFSIMPPNKVKVIQYTSKGSKFDPSNTTFGFVDESIDKLINFFNKFKDVNLNRNDLRFLDQHDNYDQQLLPKKASNMNVINRRTKLKK